jgi:hypothetical protein
VVEGVRHFLASGQQYSVDLQMGAGVGGAGVGGVGAGAGVGLTHPSEQSTMLLNLPIGSSAHVYLLSSHLYLRTGGTVPPQTKSRSCWG